MISKHLMPPTPNSVSVISFSHAPKTARTGDHQRGEFSLQAALGKAAVHINSQDRQTSSVLWWSQRGGSMRQAAEDGCGVVVLAVRPSKTTVVAWWFLL
uniref:Uncharacterized protein n=1 Tax=Arundo donax TaxID=35708 RepID=A0A0A9G370_ARUDO